MTIDLSATHTTEDVEPAVQPDDGLGLQHQRLQRLARRSEVGWRCFGPAAYRRLHVFLVRRLCRLDGSRAVRCGSRRLLRRDDQAASTRPIPGCLTTSRFATAATTYVVTGGVSNLFNAPPPADHDGCLNAASATRRPSLRSTTCAAGRSSCASATSSRPARLWNGERAHLGAPFFFGGERKARPRGRGPPSEGRGARARKMRSVTAGCEPGGDGSDRCRQQIWALDVVVVGALDLRR